MKKRRAFVRSNGALIATYHVVTYHIWCQAGNSRPMAGIVGNARPIAVFGATAARSRSAAHRPLPQSYSVHLGYQHTISANKKRENPESNESLESDRCYRNPRSWKSRLVLDGLFAPTGTPKAIVAHIAQATSPLAGDLGEER